MDAGASYSWYFTQEIIEQGSPSRKDGISLATEKRYRKDGAKFISNACNSLGLRYDTSATGVVFFHRFFMVQSFRHFDRWMVAASCLLLAGKVEETPKKCKDVLKVTRSLLTDTQWAKFGKEPKEELLIHERILLQTVRFDLQVDHPYRFLLKFAKSLKGDKSKIEKLVQMSWTFVNDSLSTTLCLQWEPQAIAVAFLYLAGKLAKHDLQGAALSRTKYWWRQFVDTLDVHDLEAICLQVLDTYSEAEGGGGGGREHSEKHEEEMQQTTPVNTGALPSTPLPIPSVPHLHSHLYQLQLPLHTPHTVTSTSTAGPSPLPLSLPLLVSGGGTSSSTPTPSHQHQVLMGAVGSALSCGLGNPLQALQTVLPQHLVAASISSIGGGAVQLQPPPTSGAGSSAHHQLAVASGQVPHQQQQLPQQQQQAAHFTHGTSLPVPLTPGHPPTPHTTHPHHPHHQAQGPPGPPLAYSTLNVHLSGTAVGNGASCVGGGSISTSSLLPSASYHQSTASLHYQQHATPIPGPAPLVTTPTQQLSNQQLLQLYGATPQNPLAPLRDGSALMPGGNGGRRGAGGGGSVVMPPSLMQPSYSTSFPPSSSGPPPPPAPPPSSTLHGWQR